MTCAICGQQHNRLADVIRSRFNVGESVELLAADYGLPLEYILVMTGGKNERTNQDRNVGTTNHADQ